MASMNYFIILQFLNNVMINQIKVIVLQVHVGPLTITFKLFGFPIFSLCSYLMKFTPETRRYLRFYCMSFHHLCRCFLWYNALHYTGCFGRWTNVHPAKSYQSVCVKPWKWPIVCLCIRCIEYASLFCFSRVY